VRIDQAAHFSREMLYHSDQLTHIGAAMAKAKQPSQVKDGAKCNVVGGTHEGKSGTVRDVKTSKTGHVTITVVQANGERFKTLAKNVVIQK
jgi:ribosomal protein S4E